MLPLPQCELDLQREVALTGNPPRRVGVHWRPSPGCTGRYDGEALRA